MAMFNRYLGEVLIHSLDCLIGRLCGLRSQRPQQIRIGIGGVTFFKKYICLGTSPTFFKTNKKMFKNQWSASPVGLFHILDTNSNSSQS